MSDISDRRNSDIPIPLPRKGSWKIVNQDSDILPVHAALLKNGKVLMFAGSQNDMLANRQGYVNVARLYNPKTNVVETVHSPFDIDLFCCGHALLSNGNLLVAGGTDKHPCDSGVIHGGAHFTGIRNSIVFDSSFENGTSPWRTAASMNYDRGSNPPRGGGRWYPSLLMLGDERILALGGHPSGDSLNHRNGMLEIFDGRNGLPGRWIDQGRDSDDVFGSDLDFLSYPRMFLLPDGNVFVVRMGDGFSYTWNPQSRRWRSLLIQPRVVENTPAVLLPLLPETNYRASVLTVGQEQPQRIDFDSQSPFWRDTSRRKLSGLPGRVNSSAIILPDGKVLVVGGLPIEEDDDSAVRSRTTTAEIYDPFSNNWEILAEAQVIRNYHSVAILLPDGSVWTAGSNRNKRTSWYRGRCIPREGDDVPKGVPDPRFDYRELRIELYYPPYIGGLAGRPVISGVDNPAFRYNSPFTIRSRDSQRIKSVALIRCSSATHAFNPDQRYVGLIIQNKVLDTVTVVSPPNPNIAPPGYYMLFVIDSGGFPSEAVIVQLTG